ncbi:MAG: hypothetical protein ACI4BC_10100 [Muribaculaceae bacterium]
MTIEEYSTLMGYTETCEFAEYETANFIYLMAGDMDKQTFCKEYKKVGSSPIVMTLAEAANSRDRIYREKNIEERQSAHALLREADEIRENGMEASADAIDNIAAKFLGRNECIKWKLNKGYTLSETDKEFITKNL